MRGAGHRGTRPHRWTALTALFCLLAACAQRPAAPDRPADEAAHPPGSATPIHAWVQLGPAGAEARLTIPGEAPCPPIEIDGTARPTALRAPPSAGSRSANPAFDPPFPVRVCAASLPAGTRTARVAGQTLPLPAPAVRRLVVLGDTGCRVRMPADGRGDPIQDCTDPEAWPWARLAAEAARHAPDLVIHLGDYHYRETCAAPGPCAALAQRGIQAGYGWTPWADDFLDPARPLLARAPWLFVRGNHENCDRAGEGWMRLLAPGAYTPCPDQRYKSASRSLPGNNRTAPAWRVDLGGTDLLVVDNAAHEDYRAAAATPEVSAHLAEQLAPLAAPDHAPERPLWLLAHKPLWYDLLAPELPANALQAFLGGGRAPARLQAVFSGHMHAFASLHFPPEADSRYPGGRPAQIVVGGSGTQLEAADPQSPLFEGRDGPGSRERRHPGPRPYEGIAAAGGILLNRFAFLLLERTDAAWRGTLIGPDGTVITRCRLADGTKIFDCPFPD